MGWNDIAQSPVMSVHMTGQISVKFGMTVMPLETTPNPHFSFKHFIIRTSHTLKSHEMEQ